MAVRVIAKAHLADKTRSYSPGDLIVDGPLYDQRDYYASLGHVDVVEEPVKPDSPTTDDESTTKTPSKTDTKTDTKTSDAKSSDTKKG